LGQETAYHGQEIRPRFTMKDGDKDVFEYSLEKKNFPEVGPNWKTYTIQPHAQEKYQMEGKKKDREGDMT